MYFKSVVTMTARKGFDNLRVDRTAFSFAFLASKLRKAKKINKRNPVN